MPKKNTIVWGVIIVLVVILAILAVQRMESVATNSNQNTQPQPVINQPVVNQNTNTPVATTESTSTGKVAPQVIGIPGVNATITFPGEWKVSRADATSAPITMFVEKMKDPNATAPSIGDFGVIVSVYHIADQDFQKWFALNDTKNSIDAIIKDANKNGLSLTRADVTVTGPNQVLVGGKLAMDEIVSYAKTTTAGKTAQTFHDIAIRSGGDVVLFEFITGTEWKDAALAEWNTAMKSFVFGK